MANKPKTKMSIALRAKQFMPFAALKGLDEALAKAEKEFTQKAELSDESKKIINAKLLKLKKSDEIMLTYYKDGEYITNKVTIGFLNKEYGFLNIGDDQVFFDDIINIT